MYQRAWKDDYISRPVACPQVDCLLDDGPLSPGAMRCSFCADGALPRFPHERPG